MPHHTMPTTFMIWHSTIHGFTTVSMALRSGITAGPSVPSTSAPGSMAHGGETPGIAIGDGTTTAGDGDGAVLGIPDGDTAGILVTLDGDTVDSPTMLQAGVMVV